MARAKGSVKKGGEYSANLMEVALEDETHPLNYGINMQAHHLLSAKGIDMSGVGEDLEWLGYNINALSNLIFLPYELKSACHMGVQMHRSNHNFKRKLNVDYHDEISKLITKPKFLKKIDMCNHGKSDAAIIQAICNLMDGLSEDVLMLIANFDLPLTSIYDDFDPGNKDAKGCGNESSVPKQRDSPNKCKLNRDHQEELFGKDGVPDRLKKHGYVLRAGQ